MDKLIKLMPDYGCSPLWEYAGGDLIDNSDPERLPLTGELKAALGRWASAYDATLNQEYPPDSGFPNPADEDAFEVEGLRLWKELQAKLGTNTRSRTTASAIASCMNPNPYPNLTRRQKTARDEPSGMPPIAHDPGETSWSRTE